MIDRLLQIVAPHHCYGCDKTGTVLCDNCKYNIISEPFSGCVLCQKPTGATNLCGDCPSSYDRAWAVGERTEVVERLLNGYKFERKRAAHRVLAELLNTSLPELPPNAVIVPMPTIAPHIRQRGYDHTLLIAKRFAKIRGLPLQLALARVTNTKQIGASRSQRIKNMQSAFRVRKSLDPEVTYLLIDDVLTTGSTVEYAAKALKDRGASSVWIAVIARQPLVERSSEQQL